jgi:hypothetical protein
LLAENTKSSDGGAPVGGNPTAELIERAEVPWPEPLPDGTGDQAAVLDTVGDRISRVVAFLDGTLLRQLGLPDWLWA